MGVKKRQKKVVKMKSSHSKVAGIILILISIYIFAVFVQSLHKPHISIYEVTEKKIADDNTVRGIIVREEKLVSSETDGYVNYFIGDGNRVGVKTTICSIDATGDIYKQLSGVQENSVKLTSENNADFRSAVSSFRSGYDSSHFSETYSFKYDVDNAIMEFTNEKMMENLTELLKTHQADDNALSVVKANESGVVSYTTDHMENLDLNSIAPDNFSDMNDKMTALRSSEAIKAGNPLYRLVTSENWTVIIPLSKEQFKNMHQDKTVTIRLKKINASVTPDITTFTMDGGYYARLDLNRYMIQYINDRYIDVEIGMNDDSGLKIPLTSIVKKKYYAIYEDYVKKDENGNDTISLLKYNKNGTVSFDARKVPVAEFNEFEESLEDEASKQEKQKVVYIPADAFPKGTLICKEKDASQALELSSTVTLDGVYCCNDGYCQFRPIEKSYKNNEYCIIKNDTIGGISAYDHIIMDASMIEDEDIIY